MRKSMAEEGEHEEDEESEHSLGGAPSEAIRIEENLPRKRR